MWRGLGRIVRDGVINRMHHITTRVMTQQHEIPSCSSLLLLGMTSLTLLTIPVQESTAQAEAKPLNTVASSILPGTKDNQSDLEEPQTKSRPRRHLRARTRYKAKLEEVDLMTTYINEYKQTQTSLDSFATRFDLYASKTIETSDGMKPMMTFTDFLHALILPRFHTKSPHPDIEYTCDFIGNGNGLISFEECFLLLHLLQIPKEHFDVAFYMFDVDGDGAVDKTEFCHVMENLLRTMSSDHALPSIEQVVPRLLLHLFGRNGKKKIRSNEVENLLDQVRKQLLQAEFDLYAIPHPVYKRVMTVHDFAITLLSCMIPERLPAFIERIEALNQSREIVTWEDFYQFHFHVQSHLSDIQLAFELIGTDEITVSDFIRAAWVVTGVELSIPIVTLAFRVFDSNDNGTLDQSELVKVLERRTHVDLHATHPHESSIKRFWKCTQGEKV